jgi:S-adenosylmethionine-dependent methyltransferase
MAGRTEHPAGAAPADRPGGWLSLAFYNRDALVYRNLLKGHFRKLRSNRLAGEKQSLTPQKPLDPRELQGAT